MQIIRFGLDIAVGCFFLLLVASTYYAQAVPAILSAVFMWGCLISGLLLDIRSGQPKWER